MLTGRFATLGTVSFHHIFLARVQKAVAGPFMRAKGPGPGPDGQLDRGDLPALQSSIATWKAGWNVKIALRLRQVAAHVTGHHGIARMKLTFLGTRGYIDAATDRHRRHTATLVEYRGRRVMIDCGADWRDRFQEHHPQAIVLTHAHPDHAWGLKSGTARPVYASAQTWEAIADYPLEDRHLVEPGRPEEIRGITFTLFPVEHSTRCPAGGYRIEAGRVTIFYVPDVVYIHDRQSALSGCKLYVGDGATVERSLVRKPGDRLIGHTPVRTQLTWCQKEGVPRAIFTHLGSEIVKGGDETAMARIGPLAEERGVDVRLAFDGMVQVLR